MNVSTFLVALRLFAIMTIITGVIYPIVITVIGQTAFSQQANGSIIKRETTAVGSSLIAQNSPNSSYFQPRPSAGNYSTVASAASNLAISNVLLQDSLHQRSAHWGKNIGEMPADLLFSSGCGLDPHISPEAAQFQVDRIARIRGLSGDEVVELRTMIAHQTENPQFGILGNNRVNVLLLNLDLDKKMNHIN
jgi:K+-transporting ATPase ATPase C chain